ncbi:hypothetical protein, partial [Ferrimonas kyonanensis]|uniref:hypothetical protein n=1 Tax=Ferrimonas kyonanensis TaxID=364763 RepID=UPI00054FFCB0
MLIKAHSAPWFELAELVPYPRHLMIRYRLAALGDSDVPLVLYRLSNGGFFLMLDGAEVESQGAAEG